MATQIPVKKQGGNVEKTGGHQGMLADMERWAGSWMSPFHLFDGSLLHETQPKCDVIEQGDDVVVRVALPGYKKDDIEVSATDSTVTIQGKSSEKLEEGEEKGNYYRKEIRTENFMRMIRLPAIVDDKQAKASFKNGLLEVTMPKTENGKRQTLKIEG